MIITENKEFANLSEVNLEEETAFVSSHPTTSFYCILLTKVFGLCLYICLYYKCWKDYWNNKKTFLLIKQIYVQKLI